MISSESLGEKKKIETIPVPFCLKYLSSLQIHKSAMPRKAIFLQQDYYVLSDVYWINKNSPTK